MEEAKKKKVLWSTDFSEVSLLALKATRFLRTMPDSMLLAMHCIENPLDDIYETATTSTVKMVDHAREVSRRKLEKILSEIGIPEKDYRLIIKVGDSGEKILEVSEEEKVASIIMGKESKGLERLMGSVSEYVVNRAKCPVLIVGQRVKNGWIKIDS